METAFANLELMTQQTNDQSTLDRLTLAVEKSFRHILMLDDDVDREGQSLEAKVVILTSEPGLTTVVDSGK
jgi:hypothetical protein